MSDMSHTAPEASLAQPPFVVQSTSGRLTCSWILQCFRPLDPLSGLYPVYLDIDTHVESDLAVTDTLLRGTSGIFKYSVFSSSNFAVDNKRKRSMPRKGSRSQWSLTPSTRCYYQWTHLWTWLLRREECTLGNPTIADSILLRKHGGVIHQPTSVVSQSANCCLLSDTRMSALSAWSSHAPPRRLGEKPWLVAESCLHWGDDVALDATAQDAVFRNGDRSKILSHVRLLELESSSPIFTRSLASNRLSPSSAFFCCSIFH